MKGVDIFCASQAATSICRSMEQISSSSSPSTATLLGGGGGSGCRVIDRHNPIIKDSKRSTSSKPTPSHPPPTSKKKNSRNNIPSDQNENQSDLSLSSSSLSKSKLDDDKAQQQHTTLNEVSSAIAKRKSWSCTRPGDFLSPPGSTRYLLREKVYYNTPLSDSDPTKLCLDESSNKDINTHHSSPSHLPQQVVVMRVSLHCRGCEKKLRKHLSRMEGVKSFDIDFPARKVTVTGNVMASDVVSSICKVMKNAQLWSAPIPSSNPIQTTHQNNNNNNNTIVGATLI